MQICRASYLALKSLETELISTSLVRASVSIAKAGATAALGSAFAAIGAAAKVFFIGAGTEPVVIVVAIVFIGYIVAATIVDKIDSYFNIENLVADWTR